MAKSMFLKAVVLPVPGNILIQMFLLPLKTEFKKKIGIQMMIMFWLKRYHKSRYNFVQLPSRTQTKEEPP